MPESLAAHGLPELLAGRYRIEQVLGKGAFGCVVRARDERLGRAVAVKVLAGRRPDPQVVVRFGREAALTAKLRHPHVVQVLDHGQEPDGLLWIVYELVPGRDLETRLCDPAPFPAGQAAELALALADALAAVHQAGLLHRDLKPGNVLLRDGETLLLADFGLARDVERGTRLTETGVLVGTPMYMPPEAFLGESASEAGDQYAWGAIAYELLYRKRARDRDTLAAMLAGAADPGPPALGRQPAFDPVLARALARAPGARFPTMAEARDAWAGARLAAGGEGPPLAPTRALPPGPVQAPAARSPALRGRSMTRSGLLLVGLAGALGLWLVPGRRSPEPAPIPPAREASPDPGLAFRATLTLLQGHDQEHGDLFGGAQLAHARAAAGDLVDPRLPLKLRRVLDELEAADDPPEELVRIPIHLVEDLLALEHGLARRASLGEASPEEAGLLRLAGEQLRATGAESAALVERVLARPAPAPATLLLLAARLSGHAPSAASVRLLRALQLRLLDPPPDPDLDRLLRARIGIATLADRGALPCPDRAELAGALLAASRALPNPQGARLAAGLLPELATGLALCPPEDRGPPPELLDAALARARAGPGGERAWLADCLARADLLLQAERGLESRRAGAAPGLAARGEALRAALAEARAAR